MAQIPRWFAISALLVLTCESTIGATFGNLNQVYQDIQCYRDTRNREYQADLRGFEGVVGSFPNQYQERFHAQHGENQKRYFCSSY